MNDDKSNENVFGFKGTDISSLISNPYIESWEFSNNNTALCLFQDGDMTSPVYDAESKTDVPRWSKSFERRYPEQEDDLAANDITALTRVVQWVASTNRNAATGDTLGEPYVAEGTTYTNDTAEYRLAKFKKEFEDYFVLEPMTFYYIYTEVFILMDSRAKNLFLTTFDGVHWLPSPYDFDSALGINNEGQLTFDYNLEDTDLVDGGNVFTGQDSVLWNNFRDCYETTEITSMYKALRSQKGTTNGTKEFSYQAIADKMNDFQDAWCETLWNTDNEVKYLQPFYAGRNYLDMAQGDKRTQRNFWLYNAFKYRDSKYMTGEAVEKYILLRLYNLGEIAVTPYSHIYARVQFGNAKDTIVRTNRNETTIFNMAGITKADDLETHIYSSDRIAKIGDLSALEIGLCDFSQAPKLQEIIVGSEAEGYRNGHLNSFTVGSSELLRLIDISNCYNLTDTIEVGQCPCLKTFKARGSAISGVNFSVGGRLEDFYLPATITGLVLREQTNLKEDGVNVDGWDNLTYLWIDSTPNVPFYEIISSSPKLENVRLVNIEWHTTLTELTTFYNRLAVSTMGSLDATGKFISGGGAVATGQVYIEEDIEDNFLSQLNTAFPNLTIFSKGKAKYFIKYVNYDNTVLYSYIAESGTAAIEPQIETPSRPPRLDDSGEEEVWYENAGWQYEGGLGLPQSIDQSYTIVAYYTEQYRIRFYDGDALLYTDKVLKGKTVEDPVATKKINVPEKAPTAQYSFVYAGWQPTLEAAKAPTDYQTKFDAITNTYKVQIFAGEKQMGNEQDVLYGTSPKLPTSDVFKYYKTADGYDYYPIYSHIGWDANDDGIEEEDGFVISPNEYTTEPIIIRALFSTIEPTSLTWEEIVAASKDGTYKTALPIGSQKAITFNFNGTSYEGVVEVIGHDYDTYADDGETAHITFLLKDIFYCPAQWANNSSYQWTNSSGETFTGPTAGGWTEGAGKQFYEKLKAISFEGEASILNSEVKPVLKRTDYGWLDSKEEKSEVNNRAETIWTPSASELGVLVIDNQTKDWQYQCGDGSRQTAYVWLTTDESRKKQFEGEPEQYWTRTTQANWRFFGVSKTGSYGYSGDNTTDYGIQTFTRAGLIFGFCL